MATAPLVALAVVCLADDDRLAQSCATRTQVPEAYEERVSLGATLPVGLHFDAAVALGVRAPALL